MTKTNRKRRVTRGRTQNEEEEGTRKQKELELYEVLILFDPNLIENEVANKIQFYQEFLVNKGSKVMVQNQGRRGLTYAIKKAESASFVQIVFLGNGKLVELFNSTIGRDESVLRNVVTKLSNPYSYNMSS